MAIKNRTYAALLAGAGSLAIVCQLNPATRAADEVIESVESEVVESEVISETESESAKESAKELTEEQRQMLAMMKERHLRLNETLKREIVELKEKMAVKERELAESLKERRNEDAARLEAELEEVQRHFKKLSDHQLQAEIAFLDSIAQKMQSGEARDVAVVARGRRRSDDEHRMVRELEDLNRHRAGNPDSERQLDRIRLLHEFGEKLASAGFPDIAHELHRRGEELEREVHRIEGKRERPEPSNAELAEQVQQLRAEVRELHEKLDILLNRTTR
ncbi:MAG: hypothetical protein JNL58_25520 [Planctomyces sp.]|nr:hypothetical protein [Planctomyces sp.]